MIHVKRPHRRPPLFRSGEWLELVERFVDYRLAGGVKGTQRRFDFEKELEGRGLGDPVREALDRTFSGKCAYTEVRAADLELTLHRPREDATNLANDVDDRHYWWLLPVWRNWYLAAPGVVLAKGTIFPVVGDRWREPASWSPTARWTPDRAILLDPCDDLPEFHLGFDRSGVVSPRRHVSAAERRPFDEQERGAITIDLLDLNNSELVARRRSAAERAIDDLEGTLADVDAALDLVNREQEHAGCVRQVVAAELVRAVQAGKIASGTQPGWGPPGAVALSRELASEIAAYSHIGNSPEQEKILTGNPHFWTDADEFLSETFQDAVDAGVIRRTYLRTGEQKQSGHAAPKREGPSVPEIWPTSHLTKVTIENFRGVERIELDLTARPVPESDDADPPEMDSNRVPWTSLLGENGSGKTSILQAIGIALAADRLAPTEAECGLAWSDLLRIVPSGEQPVERGFVRLEFSTGSRVELRFDSGHAWYRGLTKSRVSKTPFINTTVRGYGAIRLFASASDAPEPPGSDEGSNVKVSNLFDPRIPVVDAGSWLFGLDDDAFNTAALAVTELLEGLDEIETTDELWELGDGDDHSRLRLTKRDGSICFDDIPFSLMSDGYRAVITLFFDILAGLSSGYSDLSNARGIVLIDELGAHLHPRWRMRITGALRHALPNVQFIFSTHEPLCLRGLDAGEVIKVWSDADRRAHVETIQRDPGRYRVDQLLTSEFFGLDTAIDPDLDQVYQRYYRLLRLERMVGAGEQPTDRHDRAELERLTKAGRTPAGAIAELRREGLLRPAFGGTRRDQLMYDAIDNFLAEPKRSAADNEQRRQEVLARVRKIWDNVALAERSVDDASG